MRNRSLFLLVLLTFLGMVGLYFAMWKAYQIYQQKVAQLEAPGSTTNTVLNLLGIHP